MWKKEKRQPKRDPRCNVIRITSFKFCISRKHPTFASNARNLYNIYRLQKTLAVPHWLQSPSKADNILSWRHLSRAACAHKNFYNRLLFSPIDVDENTCLPPTTTRKLSHYTHYSTHEELSVEFISRTYSHRPVAAHKAPISLALILALVLSISTYQFSPQGWMYISDDHLARVTKEREEREKAAAREKLLRAPARRQSDVRGCAARLTIFSGAFGSDRFRVQSRGIMMPKWR